MDGEEHEVETFARYSNLVFIDAGAREGELFPDETSKGVYFEIDESNKCLAVRDDLGKHVNYSYMPFPFEVKQKHFHSAEFHLFEPNPEFIPLLKQKAKYISKYNCIVWVHQLAISDTHGKVKFKITDGGWGSTLCEDKQNEKFVNEIDVEKVDFLSAITGISKRAAGKDPQVHIKMDVEGAEYDILPHLFKNWHECHSIKSLSVEFHRDFFEEKHDKWIVDYAYSLISLGKFGVAFNWWPGEW